MSHVKFNLKYYLSIWCYKWLPVIMGCHCKPERSFFIKNHPFPICARCTGMLVGFILSLCTYSFYQMSLGWLCLLMIPGLTDGLIQMMTAYESTNMKRFFTGLLMGYSLFSLLLCSMIATIHLGQKIGWYLQNT